MAAYSSLTNNTKVKVTKKGLVTTGLVGEVKWTSKGLVGVHLKGYRGVLAFNPGSLTVVSTVVQEPAKIVPEATYRISHINCGNVKRDVFNSLEEATSAAERWGNVLPDGAAVVVFKEVKRYKTIRTVKLEEV